jgi:DNA topoisomerase-1
MEARGLASQRLVTRSAVLGFDLARADRESTRRDWFLLPAARDMAAQWMRRRGSKTSGFRYENSKGRPIRDAAVRERIERLRIPPAWTDVHIAASERTAIQAWGFDAKGRRQYRYHPRAVERGDRRKYYRVRQLARDLPSIRAAVYRDFHRPGFGLEQVAAGVLRLISEGFLRVGSERYAKENKTFGITTLRKSHAFVDGECVIFAYMGKRSIDQRQVVVAKDLATFVERLLATPGPRLFRYQRNGKWEDLDARDVNDYLQRVTGFPYTAKDFRTWGGTLRAATVLAELGPAASKTEAKRNVALAMRLVAGELGNTPTICRKSYVHPVLITQYLRSRTIIPTTRRGRTSRFAHTPEEKALIEFLDQHFPERRKARRVEGDEEANAAGIRARGKRRRAKAA